MLRNCWLTKAGKGAEAMQAAGLKFGEPKTLSRSGRDPISQAACTATASERQTELRYGDRYAGNVVLLALDEVKQGSMPEDQKKRWCRYHPEQRTNRL